MPESEWDELSPDEMAVFTKWLATQDNANRESATDNWRKYFLDKTVDLDPDRRAEWQLMFEAGYLMGIGDAVKGLILNTRDRLPLPDWLSKL